MNAPRRPRIAALGCIIFAGTLMLATYGAEGDERWPSYANARFGYSICHPAKLRPQGESDNSDGQRFVAADGADLTVYGANNALEQPIEALYRDVVERLGGRVTYRALKRDRFAASGFDARGRVFYVALRTRGDQYASFELTYPKVSAATYDKVAARLAGCFRIIR